MHGDTNKSIQLRKRLASEKRFIFYCRLSIMIAAGFLVFLLGSLFLQGITALRQAELLVDVSYSQAAITDEKAALSKEVFPLVSRGFTRMIPNMLRQDASLLGTSRTEWLLATAEVDQYLKGKPNRLTDAEKKILGSLKAEGKTRLPFNWRFFVYGDSKLPEMSGILASMVGTVYVIFITFIFSFPIGVMCALYLEEFAPDNRLTQIIEININNLAAIPSIIYGLLGLAIFVNFMGVPRSSALAGGLTLSLMSLPVIIVSTRSAIKAIPVSLKHAALSLGATPWQVAKDHTIPYSLPGILTGTIIALAHAMGETAPLLIVGMVAYIPEPPHGFMQAATVMPAQIYTWSADSIRAFTERTAAGILVLITVLLSMNWVAIWLRNKYERKW